MKISARTQRTNTIRRLSAEPLDLLVVGGGIVGSGVARDAAQRGLRTAILDRNDFAFGTSSRSSRLIHGGLRYLEQGRVWLVREASIEKMRMQHVAPHLTQPLGFLFPVYRSAGRPMWQMRIGVNLYDLLCGGRNFQPSRGFSRAETMGRVAGINPQDLLGAVRYYDALTQDARLVIDTIRSAERQGAIALNYLRFVDGRREGDFWKCLVEDVLTGETLPVRARTVVNATGPWMQEIPNSGIQLRLSKGIHLVVDRKELPVVDEAVVLTEGKRILFVLPWGERVIIGTTDTDYQGDPAAVRVEAADIAYVLESVRRTFPGSTLTADRVISAWAGVRALIANPDGSPSDISRTHEIRRTADGWWDVAGGKLTTYRLMAEQCVNKVVRRLGGAYPACRTAGEPLLPPTETRYSSVVPPEVTRAVVDHLIEHEWAMSLRDVMVRRTSWHYYHRDAVAVAEQVAGWMAERLDWSAARVQEELEAYQRETAADGWTQGVLMNDHPKTVAR